MTDAFPVSLPLIGERFRLEPGDDGAIAIVRRADGMALGTISARALGDTLHIEALCVDEPHRGYGAGSEAARLLAGAANGRYRTLRARSAAHLGLSVYFWTRMGFRPLHGPEPGGGIWFTRAL